jgi:hypothetical protein
MVKCSPDTSNVWFIAAQMDDRPWIVAAADPVCPLCGSALCTAIELESSFGRTVGAEEGALFDFARSLTI